MQLLIDEAIGKKNVELFTYLAIGVLFFSILSRVGVYYISLIQQKVANQITRNLTVRLTSVYFGINYENIHSKGEGYYSNRVYDESKQVSFMGTKLLFSTFENLMILLSAVAICMYLSWQVTTVLMLIVPVLYVISSNYSKKIHQLTQVETESEASFRDGVLRCLESYKIGNIFSLQPQITSKVNEMLGKYLNLLFSRTKASSKYQLVSHIFLTTAENAVLIIAAIAVFMGELTIGGLLAFMASFWKMIYSFIFLVEQVPEFSKFFAIRDRIDEFQATPKLTEKTYSPNLVAQNIGYQFDGKEQLFDFSFKLEHNDRLLVKGENGTGKSTLLHIISGFYTASGAMQGPSLKDISATLSPVKFYNGSLGEHLKYETLEQDRKALADSILADFNLSDKLALDPATFSDGEKKKSLIAMALLKEAELYIFDEPLAAVDVNSKSMIMDWITKITENKKLVMVLHGDEQFEHLFNKQLVMPSVNK